MLVSEHNCVLIINYCMVSHLLISSIVVGQYLSDWSISSSRPYHIKTLADLYHFSSAREKISQLLTRRCRLGCLSEGAMALCAYILQSQIFRRINLEFEFMQIYTLSNRISPNKFYNHWKTRKTVRRVVRWQLIQQPDNWKFTIIVG